VHLIRQSSIVTSFSALPLSSFNVSLSRSKLKASPPERPGWLFDSGIDAKRYDRSPARIVRNYLELQCCLSRLVEELSTLSNTGQYRITSHPSAFDAYDILYCSFRHTAEGTLVLMLDPSACWLGLCELVLSVFSDLSRTFAAATPTFCKSITIPLPEGVVLIQVDEEDRKGLSSERALT